MNKDDIQPVSIIPGVYDEYVCPFCLSTYFYGRMQPVHEHDCRGVTVGTRRVYIINERAFRCVDLYNQREKDSVPKQ